MRKILLLTIFVIGAFAQVSAAGPFSGRVTCNGKGVANVVVTDGIDCVLTDRNGAYTIADNRGAHHIYISTPSGYNVACKNKTIPQFYHVINRQVASGSYDFELIKNKVNDNRHLFTVQADPQVTSEKEVALYGKFLDDMNAFLKPYRGKTELFSIDCGDIVGDSPQLFPMYIDTVSKLNVPVYRAIGNHDMTYGGRTWQYSYKTFEEYFGPSYYSFNKGKAHYIVINNNFYVNRDYQYIGYIDESIFAWMEKDLANVPADHLVFVVAHIQISSTKELAWNTLLQDETSNARGLFELLEGREAHIITGHSHFNHNVCFTDKMMEHNTASACGIWWKSELCMDGTPAGYGVYEVDGNKVKWLYKSAGHNTDYQFRAYPVGTSDEYPNDVIANVWNWDDNWKVEWMEDDKVMGEMTHYTGYDPMSAAICADKSIVEYEWISPIHTAHMFRATPTNPNAKLAIKVTDRFGNVYIQKLK